MSTLLEQLEYGFDRDSRRTWRRRALTSGQDDAYGYDGLSQVVNAARGNLNLNATAIGGVPAGDESWDYDPTGNWRGYRVEENGAVTLEQRRVHDKGNRLTQVEGSPGPVLVDRAGRMTQLQPEGQKLAWDAWSRLVSVANDTDGVIGRYSYDGLSRRMTRVVYAVTWHTYYSDAWRPLEERQDDETTAARQYYWGARHRDDLVRRDRATTLGGSLDETRYVLMDYFSPAAITDENGAVTERYAFSVFGARTILAPDFSFRTTSECEWEFGFQGQFLDSESGFYDYGYRYYSPSLGRWLSKDPIEEEGGLNLYGFADNDGVNQVDYLGLAAVPFNPNAFDYRPSVRTLEGTDLGETVPSWSLRFLERYEAGNESFCFNIDGELSFRIAISPKINNWSWMGVLYQITKYHELQHVRIASKHWNLWLNEAKEWEGCYCSVHCMLLAEAVVRRLQELYEFQANLENIQFDMASYGRTPTGELSAHGYRIEALTKNFQNQITKAENALRQSKIDYYTSECGMLIA